MNRLIFVLLAMGINVGWAADIGIDIKLSQSNYLECEPILITVYFTNSSDEILEANRPIINSSLCLSLTNSEKKEYKIQDEEAATGPIRINIKPKSRMKITFSLYDYYELLKPGIYNLEISYNNSTNATKTESVKSTCSIVVNDSQGTNAQGIEEINARNLIMKNHNKGKMSLEEYGSSASDMILLYDGTLYAKYAYHWLGNRLFNELNASVKYKVIKCYEEQLRRYPDYPLTELLKYQMLYIRKEYLKEDITRAIEDLYNNTDDIDVKSDIEKYRIIPVKGFIVSP